MSIRTMVSWALECLVPDGASMSLSFDQCLIHVVVWGAWAHPSCSQLTLLFITWWIKMLHSAAHWSPGLLVLTDDTDNDNDHYALPFSSTVIKMLLPIMLILTHDSDNDKDPYDDDEPPCPLLCPLVCSSSSLLLLSQSWRSSTRQPMIWLSFIRPPSRPNISVRYLKNRVSQIYHEYVMNVSWMWVKWNSCKIE